MTIDEMITELRRRRETHGGKTEVIITWEGTTTEIRPQHVYLSKGGDLYVDADSNRYKNFFAHPDETDREPDGETD